MAPFRFLVISLLVLGTVGSALAVTPPPTAEAIAKLPPALSRPVEFARDIQPILETSCVKCHGRGKAKGDWRIDTRADFLKAGESGVSTLIGDSAHSRMIHLVAGTDPDDIMPQKGTK